MSTLPSDAVKPDFSTRITSWWGLEEAIKMCKYIEPIASQYNAHVGLTGGCLYKIDDFHLRKDLDIVFYPHGGSGGMDEGGLLDALEKAGFQLGVRFTRVQKASWQSMTIDFIFPHHEGEPGSEEDVS